MEFNRASSGGHVGAAKVVILKVFMDPVPLAALKMDTSAAHVERHDGNFLENALRLRSQRFELIAANIANADTPNYKARDIDFKAELERSVAASVQANKADLQLGSPKTGSAANGPVPATILYRMPSQSSLDGNTVEMNNERAAFAENAIMYQFALERVSGHYKMMSDLFKTLVG